MCKEAFQIRSNLPLKRNVTVCAGGSSHRTGPSAHSKIHIKDLPVVISLFLCPTYHPSQPPCSPPRAPSLSFPLPMTTVLPDRGPRLPQSGPRSLSSWIQLGLTPLIPFRVMQKKRPFVRRGPSEALIRSLEAKMSLVPSGSSAHLAKGTLVPSETGGKGRVPSLTTMHV